MGKRASISRRIDHFTLDRRILLILIMGALGIAGWRFGQDNPQHNPWAPLDLRDPPGWATQSKLTALRTQPEQCRAVLRRSEIGFDALPPAGDGNCARLDRTTLTSAQLSPARPAMTCPVAAGFALWINQSVQPAAREILGQEVRSVRHLGTFSCRRMYGQADGAWSEHATGNAIDIAGFTLADGARISLLDNWEGDDAKALFLKKIRDEACPIFGTVLSPDYNAAHRDHFHLDQADRNWGVCR